MVEVKDTGNSWENRKKDQACLSPRKDGMIANHYLPLFLQYPVEDAALRLATIFSQYPVGDTALCPASRGEWIPSQAGYDNEGWV